ncbi:MAG: thioredoxin [Bacteriovoracales bacterium]|nr:thioredoxin [Bacteriovoracales bacterium]
MAVQSIGMDHFDKEVLKSERPVLVDFWAEWCGPCKALSPILEEISEEMGEKAKIVKVNVDENGDLAQQYGIRGIPTLIFFKEGQAKKTLVGNQPKTEIQASLNELI